MANYHVPVQTSVPVATPVTNEVPEVAVTEDMKTAYSFYSKLSLKSTNLFFIKKCPYFPLCP